MEILVLSGPWKDTRYPLHDGESTVGSDPESTVWVDDPDAGWRHCRLIVRGAACELEDLRAGGTWVNGSRVQRCLLNSGDRITVGNTLLEFQENRRGDPEQYLPALLSTSMMLQAFRSLPTASPAAQARLHDQIARLVGNLLPAAGVDVYLQGQDADSGLPAPLAQHVQTGDPVVGDQGWVAMPLRVFGKTAGHIAVRPPDSSSVLLPGYQQTLAAIAGIASTALENSRELERIRVQNELLREKLDTATAIVGRSAPVRQMVQMIKRVAPSEATILILGESGTGKELVARALHELSGRHEAPFVTINCAVFNEQLLESELFGHERGAFTGAHSQKRGKLEMAEGGTVFLDEIGDITPATQVKLLRVIQEREFERVGGTKVIPLDIRLVAATNRDLAAAVENGGFRRDLYHRLNVISIRTPPLRARPGDVILLAHHFLAIQSQKLRRHVTGFTPQAETLLNSHRWPGNVRELENAVARAVIMGNGDRIEADDLPDEIRGSAPASGGRYKEKVSGARRESVLQAYQQAGGDYKEAARLLGVHPNYLLRLVRKLNLKDQVKLTRVRPAPASTG